MVYHFHTRTKTGRSPKLQEAAPEPFVQISEHDAAKHQIHDGDMIEISSRRGDLKARAKVGGIIRGHLFVPFHYGYWDDDSGHTRAANELTISAWDPVSKQPYFKCAAVKIGHTGVRLGLDQLKETVAKVAEQAHVPRQRVADAIALTIVSAGNLATSCKAVTTHHIEDSEIQQGMKGLSKLCDSMKEDLEKFAEKYGKHSPSELTRLATSLTPPLRAGAFGVLRDMQNLATAASELHVFIISLGQAARALRDEDLLATCTKIDEECKRQISWCHSQIEHRAAHAIVTKY